MSGILSAIESVFQFGLQSAVSLTTCIMDNPLLTIFTVIGLVGLGIGVFKRIVS